MIATARARQVYDHRWKLQVIQGGFDPKAVGHSLIPRSTLATWKSRPPKPLVSLLAGTQAAIEVKRDALIIKTRRLYLLSAIHF
jgi:hypothetical protein